MTRPARRRINVATSGSFLRYTSVSIWLPWSTETVRIVGEPKRASIFNRSMPLGTSAAWGNRCADAAGAALSWGDPAAASGRGEASPDRPPAPAGRPLGGSAGAKAGLAVGETSALRGSETPRMPGLSAKGPRRNSIRSPARSRNARMTNNPRFFIVSPPDRLRRTESWTSHGRPRRAPARGLPRPTHPPSRQPAPQYFCSKQRAHKTPPLLRYCTGGYPIPVLRGKKYIQLRAKA